VGCRGVPTSIVWLLLQLFGGMAEPLRMFRMSVLRFIVNRLRVMIVDDSNMEEEKEGCIQELH